MNANDKQNTSFFLPFIRKGTKNMNTLESLPRTIIRNYMCVYTYVYKIINKINFNNIEHERFYIILNCLDVIIEYYYDCV